MPLLQQLLEAKANVAAEAESGTTALLLAVWGGHQAAVALLQAHGAQPPPAAGASEVRTARSMNDLRHRMGCGYLSGISTSQCLF